VAWALGLYYVTLAPFLERDEAYEVAIG